MARQVEPKTKLLAAIIHLELLTRGEMQLTQLLQRIGFWAARGVGDILAARSVQHTIDYSETPGDDLLDCKRRIEALALDLMRKDNASRGDPDAYLADAWDEFQNQTPRGKAVEGPWRVRANDIRSALRLLQRDGRVRVDGRGARARWRASSGKRTRSLLAAYDLSLALLDAQMQ